jgi:Dyp-type peroxidase family
MRPDNGTVLPDRVSPVGGDSKGVPRLYLTSSGASVAGWFETEPVRVGDTPRELIDEALQRNSERYIEQFRLSFRLKKGGRSVNNLAVWLDRAEERSNAMRCMVDLTAPLDLENPASQDFLSNVQANILKAHARAHGRYLLARFHDRTPPTPEMAKARRASMAALARRVITSAATQRKQSWCWKNSRGSELDPESMLVGTMGISVEGYRALGFADDQAPGDAEFRKGLHAAGSGNPGDYVANKNPWDPDLCSWDEGFLPVDFLIHLAHEDERYVDARADELERLLSESDCCVRMEKGKRRIHEGLGEHEVIEHFGFAEGLSSPTFIRQEAPRHFVWPRGDGAIPLNLLFADEPELSGVGRSQPTYGSYGAFMKLEQNVVAFRSSAGDLADTLGVCPAHAAALATGRRQDGRPLVTGSGKDFDDFDYSGDVSGSQCPHHAHVRRMNVRRDSPFSLVRRGMSYGAERTDLYPGSTDAPPDHGVGLLFLSFQSSIRAFSSRMSAALEPTQGGSDAILGRSLQKGAAAPAANRQEWAKASGKRVPVKMVDFVIPKGGEYFFFPSLWFFENLPNVK